MAHACRVVRNPSDPEAVYKLFTNGFIKNEGTALPIPQVDRIAAMAQSEGSRSAPHWYVAGHEPAIGLHIQTWTPEPAGWVFDVYGGLFPFGDVPDMPGWGGTFPDDGFMGPFNTFPLPLYADFTMNPSGDGTGFALLSNAEPKEFGTGLAAVPGGPLTAFFESVRIYMDWPTKRYYVLNRSAQPFHLNGAEPISWRDFTNDGFVYPNLFKFRPNAVCMHVADFDTGDAWLFTSHGQVWPGNDAEHIFGSHYHPGHEGLFTDHAVLDDGSDPEVPWRGVHMAHGGSLHEFVSSTPPVVHQDGRPADPEEETTRPTVGWVFEDSQQDAQTFFEVRVLAETEWDIPGGVNERQQIAITGGPTGGGFGIWFDDQATTIDFDATATEVKNALEALSRVGVGNITATGGPLPATPVVVEFVGALAKHNWPIMPTLAGFTGGASPAVAVTTTQAGVGVDPETADAVWETDGTDRWARSVDTDVDLVNDVYRAYFRANDAAGQESDWAYRHWTQDVTPLATPVVTATAGATALDGIDVAVNGDAGLAALGALLGVQYLDAGDTEWQWVRDATALEPDGSGDATVTDHEARFGVARTYRAIAYDPFPWRASPWSATDADTITDLVWAVTNPSDPTQGGEVALRSEQFEMVRKIIAGKFEPDGRTFPVVVTDGGPKAATGELELWALDEDAWEMIRELTDANASLLIRNPLGRAWYVRLVGDLPDRQLVNAAPAADEDTPSRYAYEVDLPLTEVERPTVGPLVAEPLASLTA